MAEVDTGELDAAVEAFAERLRALSESRLRRGAGAAGLEVARALVRGAHRLDGPFGASRVMPDAGVWVVGDQVAVAGHDLARAIGTTSDEEAARRELAEALELLRRA
ncbi:hypothetical protein [Streptomyces sp. NBC_01803]|uniref:hypothetical protein n=1 Tax=Streptomyces sp. NBC_01803 TaxID=2975946 RepID=UPI002DD89848|nr:hypothetical protein [Streptomyces sp. NBC_01803]WSA44518.1 hypothetical protein OIE51_10060 [Streptomyces sp. NBC_01803]